MGSLNFGIMQSAVDNQSHNFFSKEKQTTEKSGQCQNKIVYGSAEMANINWSTVGSDDDNALYFSKFVNFTVI